MISYPPLQSWAIPEDPAGRGKYIKAHDYLDKNPHIKAALIRNSHVHKPLQLIFRTNIARTYEDENGKRPLDVGELLDILKYWDLLDILDVNINNEEYFLVSFRNGVSAYALHKIPGISCKIIDKVPKTCRAPYVIIQGLDQTTTISKVRQIFSNVCPILSFKMYQFENSDVSETKYYHVIKVSSIRFVNKLVEKDNPRLDYSKETRLRIQSQYKSTITNSFFIASKEGYLNFDQNDVVNTIGFFGQIEQIFTYGQEKIFIKMNSIQNSRHACAYLCTSMKYPNIHCVFITPQYFNQVFDEISKKW